MSHYSNNAASVRVDVFQPSGKWYETLEVIWPHYYGKDMGIKEAFKLALEGRIHHGMTYVCLEPYHEHAHPLMVTLY